MSRQVATLVEFTPKGLTKQVQNNLTRSTLIEGARSADWWAEQSRTLQNKFMRTVRTGIENGEAAGLTAARITGGTIKGEAIKGFMDTSRRQARTLVRQSTAEVANAARLESFKANDDVLKGYQQLSTFDERTTEICIAYSGAAWDLDGNPIEGTTLPFENGPPRHWNCRSILIPIVKSWEEMDMEGPALSEGTRASLNGQVAGDMSFSKWLRTQPKEIQTKLLGTQKANLFRANKLNLKDLVNVAGQGTPTSQAVAAARNSSTGYRGHIAGSKKEAAHIWFDNNYAALNKSRSVIIQMLMEKHSLTKNTATTWFQQFQVRLGRK